MNPKYMTQEFANAAFERLQNHLKKKPLSCQNGPDRIVDASEFMYMQADDFGSSTTVGFKHSDTRNYVYLLNYQSWNELLFVPKTPDPWKRGFFDKF